MNIKDECTKKQDQLRNAEERRATGLKRRKSAHVLLWQRMASRMVRDNLYDQ